MEFLYERDKFDALNFIHLASEIALKAKCDRSKCGSVIVKDGQVIGYGFNGPPSETQKRCHITKRSYHSKVTDKTCCVHAEQRAIMDALIKNPNKIFGSRLYFVRLDKSNMPKRSGRPYCTICSKMALDAGIKEFVLWQENGICVYNTDEYNELSFRYDEF